MRSRLVRRCDVEGNVWRSSNAGRAVGYNGATVWSPAGKLIGRIRTPEIVANVCFGGPKRNRLFIAASQSLYAPTRRRRGRLPAEPSRVRRARLNRRPAVDVITHRPQLVTSCRFSSPGWHDG